MYKVVLLLSQRHAYEDQYSKICYNFLMKKSWKITLVVSLAISLVAYLYFAHTTRGKVLSLYAFGSFKAPISQKITCAKQTDQKVQNKFTLPLDFDQDSKNALREFWHFSYYRACLFEAGYDFYGNKIAFSSITKTNNETRYQNNFSKISFAVPNNAIIVSDNSVNPDLDDYIITSIIRVDDYEIIVQADRSKKDVTSLSELEDKFTGFATTSAAIVDRKQTTNQAGSAILAIHQEDAMFGFLTLNPEHLAITVYGEKLPKSLLDMIESSFTFTK